MFINTIWKQCEAVWIKLSRELSLSISYKKRNNKDWSLTPALKAYRKLIFEEWWTENTVTLDENGKAELPAFYGNYKIIEGSWETNISLEKKNGLIKIKVGK